MTIVRIEEKIKKLQRAKISKDRSVKNHIKIQSFQQAKDRYLFAGKLKAIKNTIKLSHLFILKLRLKLFYSAHLPDLFSKQN